DIHSVLVEGGPTILRAFLDAKAWDEATILKSCNEWELGKKAPWIGIPSSSERKSGADTIKHFHPA
ncbi:MAG: riboflavin biosynthesis protein RibD, partial [Bacteroidia bacterium]